MVVYKCVRAIKEKGQKHLLSFNTADNVSLANVDGIVIMNYTPPRKVFGCYGPLFAFRTREAANGFITWHSATHWYKYTPFEIWEAQARPHKLQPSIVGDFNIADYKSFWDFFKHPSDATDFYRRHVDCGFTAPLGNIYCDWIKLVRRIEWTGEQHNL